MSHHCRCSQVEQAWGTLSDELRVSQVHLTPTVHNPTRRGVLPATVHSSRLSTLGSLLFPSPHTSLGPHCIPSLGPAQNAPNPHTVSQPLVCEELVRSGGPAGSVPRHRAPAARPDLTAKRRFPGNHGQPAASVTLPAACRPGGASLVIGSKLLSASFLQMPLVPNIVALIWPRTLPTASVRSF